MATTTRDGNEKRGVSPSNAPPHTQRRSSPNPPKVEKSVPNYLKATASSALDASKQQGKKPGSVSHKAAIARRRSFDRPPSSSSSSLTTSSVTRANSGNPLRSSSFSGKSSSSTTQKTLSERNVKRATKDAGKQDIHGRPVGVARKSGAAVKKREIGGGSDTEKEPVCNPIEKLEGGSDTEKEQFCNPIEKLEVVSDTETEQIGNPIEKLEVFSVIDASEPENLSDIQDSPVAEPIVDTTEIDGENTRIRDLPQENHENVAAIDPAVIVEQENGQKLDEDTSIKTPIQNKEPDAVTMEDEEPKETLIQEKQIEENDEKPIEDEDTETTEKPEKIPNEEISETQDAEEKVLEEDVKSGEGEASSVAAVEGKADTRREKKETMAAAPAVSNDVIEETAKQLREQRKNRVRALAGAFETVISMQEPK